MTPILNHSDLSHFTLPSSPVLRVGITGGIGSGKSYICRQLEAAGHPVFYCDNVAKHIIRTHPKVQEELLRTVGPEVYDTNGMLVKSVLRAFLCRGREYADKVDAIVHPRVAEAFLEEAEQMAADRPQDIPLPAPFSEPHEKPHPLTVEHLQALPKGRVLFMECALLFETAFDRLVDRSVLIHVSEATQLSRLMARDHISEEQARKWMALQLSEEKKLGRADYVLDNEH